MRPRWKKMILIAPLAVLGMALFAFLGGEVVKLLWNWLLPPLFGWPQLTFWQAFAMLALCRILFGGFGFRGGPRHRMGHRMRDRCGNMTPEEREKFRQAMRERWGFGTPAGESKAQ